MRLEGIEGTHLLGFMSSLGLLTVLDKNARDASLKPPRLSFGRDGVAALDWEGKSEKLPAVLLKGLREWAKVVVHELGAIEKPADFTTEIIAEIASKGSPQAIALMSGLVAMHRGEPLESTLCAANGSGHQALIQSFRDVLALVDEPRLEAALFRPWTRAWAPSSEERAKHKLGDRKVTLRLESTDERLYALRASNPTGPDSSYETELGAQALAVPAFSVLPIVPRRAPMTVASSGTRGRCHFHWGLWSVPSTLDTVRLLLWLGTEDVAALKSRGVFSAFRVARVTGAKGKLSFAPVEGDW